MDAQRHRLREPYGDFAVNTKANLPTGALTTKARTPGNASQLQPTDAV
ncbi:MAG TPA: hypothetical protein VF792_04960 [Ktedonobacterales bacterium]